MRTAALAVPTVLETNHRFYPLHTQLQPLQIKRTKIIGIRKYYILHIYERKRRDYIYWAIFGTGSCSRMLWVFPSCTSTRKVFLIQNKMEWQRLDLLHQGSIVFINHFGSAPRWKCPGKIWQRMTLCKGNSLGRKSYTLPPPLTPWLKSRCLCSTKWWGSKELTDKTVFLWMNKI